MAAALAIPKLAPRIQTFLCTGVGNEENDTDDHCVLFHREYGVRPKPIYNEATTKERLHKLAGGGAALTSLNVIGGAISALTIPILAPLFLGTAAASGAVIGQEIRDIQDDKMDIARKMANKVKNFLKNNPGSHVLLIGHSQGAHITDLALDYLQHLHDRIRVITIGGLVKICQRKAKHVINVVNKGDTVANKYAPAYAKLFLGGMTERCDGSECTSYTKDTDRLGHDLKDYHRNPLFRHYFRKYSNV